MVVLSTCASLEAGQSWARSREEESDMTTQSQPEASTDHAAKAKRALEMLESPAFRRLIGKRWAVSAVLTAILFGLYYGYILLIGYDRALLSTKIGEHTTLGIPMGVGVIILSWLLTIIYVSWANRSYDPAIKALKAELDK
jgi:uncharacterized membrane protein (DUF485 family)